MDHQHFTRAPWVYSIISKTTESHGVFIGEVIAMDPRDALSRALTTHAGNGMMIGQYCNVPDDVILDAPGNFDTSYEIALEHVEIKVCKVSLASFEPPEGWEPGFSRYRHGGWYSTVRYPTGASVCVSRNYPDGKWRIVCDRRQWNPGKQGDITFPNRVAATRAEYVLTKLQEAGLYPSRY